MSVSELCSFIIVHVMDCGAADWNCGLSAADQHLEIRTPLERHAVAISYE